MMRQPSVLIVMMNRFLQHSRDASIIIKNSDPIFPSDVLPLRPNSLHLTSVIIHNGSHKHEGHIYTILKRKKTMDITNFTYATTNDDNEITLHHDPPDKGYLYFYEQTDSTLLDVDKSSMDFGGHESNLPPQRTSTVNFDETIGGAKDLSSATKEKSSVEELVEELNQSKPFKNLPLQTLIEYAIHHQSPLTELPGGRKEDVRFVLDKISNQAILKQQFQSPADKSLRCNYVDDRGTKDLYSQNHRVYVKNGDIWKNKREVSKSKKGVMEWLQKNPNDNTVVMKVTKITSHGDLKLCKYYTEFIIAPQFMNHVLGRCVVEYLGNHVDNDKPHGGARYPHKVTLSIFITINYKCLIMQHDFCHCLS